MERQWIDVPGRESQFIIFVHHCASSGKVVISRLVASGLRRYIVVSFEDSELRLRSEIWRWGKGGEIEQGYDALYKVVHMYMQMTEPET